MIWTPPQQRHASKQVLVWQDFGRDGFGEIEAREIEQNGELVYVEYENGDRSWVPACNVEAAPSLPAEAR